MFYLTFKLSCLTIIVNVQETDKYRIAISITNSSIWCESHGDDCESFKIVHTGTYNLSSHSDLFATLLAIRQAKGAFPALFCCVLS